MDHEELRDKELSELEAALGGLLPRPSRLDRDRLLFLAGQASASSSPASAEQRERPNRRHWIWPAISALSTAAAVVLAVLLVMRPGPQVVREIVYVERPEPLDEAAEEPHDDGSPAIEALGPMDLANNESPPAGTGRVGPNYLELRRRVFEVGLAALPDPQPVSGSLGETPATQREMMREFLGDQEPAGPPARLLDWPFSTGDVL